MLMHSGQSKEQHDRNLGIAAAFFVSPQTCILSTFTCT